jgi:hypothetical protein
MIDHTFAPDPPYLTLPPATAETYMPLFNVWRLACTTALSDKTTSSQSAGPNTTPAHGAFAKPDPTRPVTNSHSSFPVVYQQAAVQHIATWREITLGLPEMQYGNLAGGTEETHVNLGGLGTGV